VVFMLQRLGWFWTACGSGITLSEEGLVANVVVYRGFQLVSGGEPMTEGRHYWEVEITNWPGGECLGIGAVRPGLDHDKDHSETDDAYFIDASDGTLCGNGKDSADEQGGFAQGDCVGVLLDLDAGWLRFYRNGERCGPGYTEGVTGPLMRAAQLVLAVQLSSSPWGDKVTVLPGAAAPEGAGAADEPWEGPESEADE
jgi:hypothetical protein